MLIPAKHSAIMRNLQLAQRPTSAISKATATQRVGQNAAFTPEGTAYELAQGAGQGRTAKSTP